MGNSVKNVAGHPHPRQVRKSLDALALAGIADEDLERAIVDYVDGKLACRGEHEAELDIVNALSEGVRALYLTWTVESEVIEGGFVRYFWSWAGQLAREAAAACEFFSAHEHARLIREANRVYAEECGKTYLVGGRELIDAHGSWRLQVLEDYLYQIDESLSALRIAKIRADPQAFCDD